MSVFTGRIFIRSFGEERVGVVDVQSKEFLVTMERFRLVGELFG